MLRLRARADTNTQTRAILVSDNGRFISQIRLLLDASETRNLLMATTVNQAIQLVAEGECYCALLDHTLAGGAGIQAVELLRRKLPWPELAIPVILITEHATIETIRSAVLGGVDEVLSLPVTSEALRGRILSARLRPRPFVTTTGYDGPCRRRRPASSLLASEFRRADDLNAAHARRLAREVHGHLVGYNAAQRVIHLLSPSMLAAPGIQLHDAATDLYECTLGLQDPRISGLAHLCCSLAESPERVRKDPTLMLGTLRDLVAVIESRLRRTAVRLEGRSSNGNLAS